MKKKKITTFYLFALYKLATKLFEAALGDKAQGKRRRQHSLLSCIWDQESSCLTRSLCYGCRSGFLPWERSQGIIWQPYSQSCWVSDLRMEPQEQWQEELDLSPVTTENSQSVFCSYRIPRGGEVGRRMKEAFLFFSLFPWCAHITNIIQLQPLFE